jgi:hypothetical protein
MKGFAELLISLGVACLLLATIGLPVLKWLNRVFDVDTFGVYMTIGLKRPWFIAVGIALLLLGVIVRRRRAVDAR